MGLHPGNSGESPRTAQAIAREFAVEVRPEEAGMRLDVFLAEKIPALSRSQAQKLIKEGLVTLGGTPVTKPKYRVQAEERFRVILPPPQKLALEPQEVPFEILYEDQDLVVINKPAGVVVHPAAGHYEKTLVHGLLARLKDLSGIGGTFRPGIVHRLDKDTSGLMVVAKNDQAHERLSRMFKERRVKKVYLALVHGVPQARAGRIVKPLGRHPVHRKKMAVVPGGRFAETIWRVKETFRRAALLELEPVTGRTHQLRVHLASIGHPIVGDALYGGAKPHGPKARRQLLHAYKLSFEHPRTGERLSFEGALPPDFEEVLHALREEKAR